MADVSLQEEVEMALRQAWIDFSFLSGPNRFQITVARDVLEWKSEKLAQIMSYLMERGVDIKEERLKKSDLYETYVLTRGKEKILIAPSFQ
jgi:hypothetical protein